MTPETLRWIAGLGAVTAEALAAHEATSVQGARGTLAAAQRAGLVRRFRPLHRQPALHALTARGLRACDAAGLGAARVTAGNATHLIACARVAAALGRRHPRHRVVGERELRSEERARGRAVASARLGLGLDGHPALHRPDLVLLPRDAELGRPVAVEVELTVKAPRRLAALVRAWARCDLVDGVLYLAPDHVARAVARAIAETAADERVVVLPLDP